MKSIEISTHKLICTEIQANDGSCRGVSVKTPAGNGRDFYDDGTEYDWQDGNGLESREPELLVAAREAVDGFKILAPHIADA